MKEFTVFLASTVSGEFKEERSYFDSEIKTFSKEHYYHLDIDIIPRTSDNMGKVASIRGTQPRYNTAIRNSCLVVFLIGEHLGGETLKEFKKANSRRKRGKLSICVYFKENVEADETVTDFRKELERDSQYRNRGPNGDRGIYYDVFSQKEDLLHKIEKELRICLESASKRAEAHHDKGRVSVGVVIRAAVLIVIIIALVDILALVLLTGGFGHIFGVKAENEKVDVQKICFWEDAITLAPGESRSLETVMDLWPDHANPADIDYDSTNRAVAYVKPREPGEAYRSIIVPADWKEEDGLYADITAGIGTVVSINSKNEPGGVRVTVSSSSGEGGNQDTDGEGPG